MFSFLIALKYLGLGSFVQVYFNKNTQLSSHFQFLKYDIYSYIHFAILHHFFAGGIKFWDEWHCMCFLLYVKLRDLVYFASSITTSTLVPL